MKHVIKWIIAMAMTAMLLLTSCQISGVSGADTSISSVAVEKFGNVEIRLPGDGRGWSPAMYEVTASRSGEADVVETTTSSSLSLRLKVGSWSFVARAYDSANVMIYQSSAKTATVNESNNSAISLLLDQQSSSVKYTFATDDSLGGSINRVEISAASATSGFDIQTVTVSSIDQVVTLKGLLASSAYNITVKGYINDVLYAEGFKTLNAINNTTTIKNDGAIILSQTKVTPVTSTSADGSSFSSNTAKIMLSTKTAGATIYYTTNGTTPTTSSSVYPAGGISLFNGMGAAGSKTVKAIAAAAGMSNSEVFSATYTYNPGVAATPTFSPIGGTYNDDIEVELTNNETSGSVEYSTDNTHWQIYTSKIAISGSKTEDVAQTIYARATGVTDKTDSAAVSQTYTVSYPQLASVTISPEAGQYGAEQYYTLSASVAGATIYYTTDGTEPTTSSKVYTAPFNFAADGTYTVKTFVVADKYKDSAVAVYGEYKIITSQNGGVNFKLAKALYYDSTKETWTNDEQDALFEANTSVILSGSGFTAGTEYTLTYPAGLSAAVEIYKGSDETKITGTQSAGSVTFTPPQSGKYYFVFNITESDMDNVQIVIAKSGTDIPVDAVAVTPNGASMDVGGDAVTFTVTYSPSNATTGKSVSWTVGNSTVISMSGTGDTVTITALAAGTSTLTAETTNGKSKTVTITAATTTTTTSTTTTTTIAPIVSTDLGEMHPTSGSLSPVSQSTWGSSKYVLGANVSGGNTTFALYSANATKVLLEIYDAAYGEDAKYDYWMTQHSSSKQWQAKLQGDLSGKYYAFRVWGPNWKYDSGWKRGGSSVGMVGTHDCDSNGNRFNPNKVVYDPYAREITHDPSNATALAYSPTAPANPYGALSTGDTYRNYDSGKIAPKGIVVTDNTNYGTKPAIPQKDAIIYEAHVRGITKHSSSANLATLLSKYSQFGDVVNIPTEYQGTYKGAAMLVPYLKALGINTIELLPVHETDNDANPDDGPGGNFWGYMTFNYFAPDRRYSSDKTPGGPTKEFKEMVKAFHDAGMEVYLDVVYNHTGEGGTWHGSSTDPNFDNGKQCTVVSMRGIDNATYYSLVKGSKWAYWETTGCGNNMQCDNAYVRQFILDSLTYWIDTMGVDGFRFDLATTLGREYNSSTGNWNYNASAATLTQIAALGQTKNAEMIAESWDCGDGSYQVGNFPDGWAGWNGYYRDNIRGFVGNAQAEAAISYTTGLYGDLDHFGVNEPSINFIVAHDGFTLADLCSYSGSGNYYNDKLAWPFGPSDGGNGDQNNISTNIYVNGSVDEQASRRQRARNYFAMQMFSAGIPMIVYGDEFGRTQNGNNNPYNIDSVATWNNYNMVNTASPQAASTGGSGTYTNMFGTFGNTAGKNGNFDFARFVMNERLNNNSLRQVSGAAAPMEWYSTAGTKGWADEGNAKAIMINGSKGVDGAKYYMMINMKGDQTTFTVPKSDTGSSWVRIVDTGNWAETDCNYWEETDASAYSFSAATQYGVGPYTVVIFKQVEDTPTCAAPTISGTTPFDGSTSVTMSSTTSGVTIYYTTDGSTPTTNSSRYTSAISVSKTTTFKAIAVKTGYNSSSVTTKKFTKNALTCATPVISGTTPFEGSTTVSISCSSPSGVSVYYTTNGSTPTTGSTKYTAPFTLTETTTVRAIAVYSGYEDSEVSSKTFSVKSAESSKSGVMLQGFNWDSAPRGNSSKWYRWYGVMTDNASAIKNTFAYVWCPPPSKTDTASSEGYSPTELNDLNNCYGSETQLRAMINAISPAKAVADIVINHRSGSTSWGDFVNPDWGVVKGSNYKAICSDDEGFSGEPSLMGAVAANMRGNTDSGEQYSASRDLDHKASFVRDGIKTWMKDVLKDAGFVGWRYDFVKGYSGQYVGEYNAYTSAEFSVGEFWPTPTYSSSDWGNQIKNWVAATATNGGQKSRAFDFALKGAMNMVFGYNTSGQSNSGFDALASSDNLFISQPADAVTFIDNHDTGSTQKHWYLDPNDIGIGYTLILTHPGYPCVAWQHYFTYAESGSNGTDGGAQYVAGNTVPGTTYTLRQHIDNLIELRKSIGIEYDSERTTVASTSGYYVAEITGTNGSILVEIGSGWSPTGAYADYEFQYSGTDFAIWTNGQASTKCKAPVITFNNGTCTITCATDNATIYYTTNNTAPTTSSAVYGDSFAVTEGVTVRAIATAAGLENSNEATPKTYSTSITLHFTNNCGWSNVYAYFFDTGAVGAAWPGTEISWAYDNDMGQGVYTVTTPAGANYVIFNSGNGAQTENITLPASNQGYYISGGESNAYTVGLWTP